MKFKLFIFILLASSAWTSAQSNINYPSTRTDVIDDTIFNYKVRDPYRWLENGKSSETISWEKAQNTLSEDYLSHLPKRAELTEKFKSLYYVDFLSLPQKRGHRLFYEKNLTEREQPLICWKEKTEEHILIDPSKIDSNGQRTIEQWIPSPNGNFVAYAIHENNADKGILKIRDVKTAKQFDENIGWEDYCDLAWSADNKGFYYTRISTSASVSDMDRVANADVAYHRLGTDPSRDPSIYPKTGDSALYLTPSVSRDGHWLFVTINRGWTNTNIYFRDQRKLNSPFIPLFISTSATATIMAWNDYFYLKTNRTSPHYEILRVDLNRNGAFTWTTVIPGRHDVTIESAKIIGGHLILKTLEHASNHIEVWSLDGKHLRDERLPAEGSVSDLSGEENSDEAFYEFESFAIPPEIYKMSVSSPSSKLWATQNISFDPSLFKIDKVFFPSKDGTPISMFLVHDKNLKPDGSMSFLLKGYGGFKVSLLPRFSVDLIPLLEAGIGVAIPHLRGGGEYGENWHQAGMLTKKQNTFDDFLAATQFLIDGKYTRSDRLAIEGVSNGGLLVGAVLTQRPDLFRVAVCKVPLLDMIRYPLFGQGPAWVPEYGSPENEEEFRALLAYSPYHHVKTKTSYPSVLIISADSDDRVDPMHARKMAAALQAANSSSHPIMLLTISNAGHGGTGLTRSRVEEMVDRTSFIMGELGVHHNTPDIK